MFFEQATMNFISIIIPVFNAENTLEKCIQSILNQNYTQFEIIIVNDGSTDSTGKICLNFASIDSRIIVLNKENEGVSAARNDGIACSKGQNIIFCDADDIMMPDTLSNFECFSNIDFVLGSYQCIPSSRKEIFPDVFIDNLNEMGLFVRQNLFKGFSTPWAKMYKSSIIKENKIFFDENISSGEDTLWVNEYLTYCTNLRSISFSVYQYHEELSVLSKNGISENTLLYSIDRLSDLVLLMESRFNVSFEILHRYQSLYFFQRFVVLLSSLSIKKCFFSLKRVAQEKELIMLFKDPNGLIKKGIRLRVFNQMMVSGRFVIAALIVKLTKRYV